MTTDYLLLYSGGSMPESEEEQSTVMKAWDVWMHDLGSALKDGGNPFAPGAAKTISNDGAVQRRRRIGERLLDHLGRLARRRHGEGEGLPGAAGWSDDRGVRDLLGDVAGIARTPHRPRPDRARRS